MLDRLAITICSAPHLGAFEDGARRIRDAAPADRPAVEQAIMRAFELLGVGFLDLFKAWRSIQLPGG